MDQIMVDVSRAPHAEPGITAEIMGPHIPVTELAEKAGTISWEIFTGIGPGYPATTPTKPGRREKGQPAAHFWGLLSRLTDRQKYRLVSQYDEGFHQRTLRAAPDD